MPPNILLVGGCGYIGSYLYQRLARDGFTVTVVDQLKRGNPLGVGVVEDDYARMPDDFLAQFDVVLWFAGHSNVKDSTDDPDGAVLNNCLNLFAFAKRLPSRTKLIYASTGVIYSTKGTAVSPASEGSLARIPSLNAYDMSKFAFDYLATAFLKNSYGLRLGTLCGYSPNLRAELVFNGMNIDAVSRGCVHLKNINSSRTFLFLSDLWVFVRKLITTPQHPGIYNVGSVSLTIGQLARVVGDTWNAQVIYEGGTDPYSYVLDTTRMQAICGNELEAVDLPQRCRQFIEMCGQARIVP